MELYKMETRQRRPGVEFVPVMPGTSGGGGGRASKGD